MASITEYHTTGEGDSVGLESRQRTRTFTLLTDAVTDDPIAKFRELLPLETTHEKDAGIIVRDHVILERGAPLAWRVQAIYSQPPRRGVFGVNDWFISVRFNGGTETLFTEIPDEEDADIARQIVGTLKYEKVAGPVAPTPEEPNPPASTATHITRSKPAIYLKQIDGVNPKGMPVVAGDTSIVLRKTTNVMSPMIVKKIADMQRAVNSDRFMFRVFPPGSLLFTAFSINERVGTLDVKQGDQFLYDNQLEFLYNPKGHTPVKKFDTFVDSDQFEHLVHRLEEDGSIGAEEERYFRAYPSIVFAEIIKAFPMSKWV